MHEGGVSVGKGAFAAVVVGGRLTIHNIGQRENDRTDRNSAGHWSRARFATHLASLGEWPSVSPGQKDDRSGTCAM